MGRFRGQLGRILTMSVLDHVPDEAVETLASKFATDRPVRDRGGAVDRREAETARYKYSRDTRRCSSATAPDAPLGVGSRASTMSTTVPYGYT